MKIFHVVLRTVLFVGLFFVGSSLSCSLFDKVDDVTFEVEIEHTFVINEGLDSQGQPVSYSKTETIDPNSNAEFAKYRDKIKEITVNSVTYTVSDYNSPHDVTFSNGKGSFISSAGSATAFADAAITVQNVPGSVGGSFSLNYTIAGLEELAKQIKDIQSVDFQVSGTFSQTPVAFKVPVTINCTIKADAL